MTAISWNPPADTRESLAIAVHAILTHARRDTTFDATVAILGLGAATVALPGECIGTWSNYARDFGFPDAPRRLGLHVRALHPPEACAGLTRSAQYEIHFRDSYLPLIRRALDAGQFVLAWCGWPAPAQAQWGVLVDWANDAPVGYVPGHDAPVPLSGPAHQVYVVERVDSDGAEPRADELLDCTFSLARHTWTGAVPVAPDVVTGARAFDAWLAVARAPEKHTVCGHYFDACHREFITDLIQARNHLARWLASAAPSLSPQCAPTDTTWRETCEATVAALTPFATAGAEVAERLQDRARLLDALERVRSHEAALYAR